VLSGALERRPVPVLVLAGLMAALLIGLVMELLVLVFVLIRFAASANVAQRAISPTDSQRGDRRFTILASTVLGLVFWPFLGLSRGLGVGLVLGLLLAQKLTNTGWPPFVLASLWLWARRRLPLRLMGFLDDAYRLGLLRIVGPVYQFRHAALQDHLAPPGEVMPPVAAPPHDHRISQK
jgi:uncharacterized membrane protein